MATLAGLVVYVSMTLLAWMAFIVFSVIIGFVFGMAHSTPLSPELFFNTPNRMLSDYFFFFLTAVFFTGRD